MILAILSLLALLSFMVGMGQTRPTRLAGWMVLAFIFGGMAMGAALIELKALLSG